MPTKLFISYRSLDSAKVDTIVSRLRSLKGEQGELLYDVWQDKENIPIGQDWWQAILEAIRECHVFIFMISEESAQNVNCRAELEYASKCNRPIIPMVLPQEFTYNQTTGKNDVSFWQHIPQELNDLRAQFLFYEGTRAFTLIKETVERLCLEREEGKWPDRDLPDPLSPDDATDDLGLYDQACDHAHLSNFAEAERLFDKLSKWDSSIFKEYAEDWISILREYTRLVRLYRSSHTRNMLPDHWKRYASRFPTPYHSQLFDPNELGQDVNAVYRLSEDDKAFLNKPYRVVFVGSSSTGKSTLANAILGREILPSSALQGTTPHVTIIQPDKLHRVTVNYNSGRVEPLQFSDLKKGQQLQEDVDNLLISCNSSILDDLNMNLVDTPGFDFVNLPDRDRKKIFDEATLADVVVFVVNVVQVLSVNERDWINSLMKLGQEPIIVINGIDLIRKDDLPKIIDHVNKIVTKEFGRLKIFYTSAWDPLDDNSRDVGMPELIEGIKLKLNEVQEERKQHLLSNR